MQILLLSCDITFKIEPLALESEANNPRLLGEKQMKDRTRYVFGAALAGLAIGGMADRGHAAIVTNAQFTFESLMTAGQLSSTGTTTVSVTQSSFGPVTAEIGTGTAMEVHVSTATAYSDPAGNGSAHSLASSGWAVGDYYQFNVPTSSITGVLINFSQTSSGTGPEKFRLQYSLDGSTFTDFTTFGIPVGTNSATIGFSGPTATATGLMFSFDLSGVTGLDNDPSAAFRIVDNSTLAYNGISGSAPNGTATVAVAGTDRIDDFTVSGTQAAVPEPSAIGLLTAAASLMLGRRRK
jgi:hypothetical protein